ncbi:hypothetical protein Arub01_48180 [Actinomadura rubrobrunea]|uniref:Transposase n=1 Tax=Actinomadura rubrobrunea TaxID=115335 RepID=A0A9W6UWU3_9ACTN|nr:hypothetical protein Arub01_48180 [Actinomadura rubrobrunea]
MGPPPAYACDAERQAASGDRLGWYNHHRPHTGIAGQTPAARVTNLSEQDTSAPEESTRIPIDEGVNQLWDEHPGEFPEVSTGPAAKSSSSPAWATKTSPS